MIEDLIIDEVINVTFSFTLKMTTTEKAENKDRTWRLGYSDNSQSCVDCHHNVDSRVIGSLLIDHREVARSIDQPN